MLDCFIARQNIRANYMLTSVKKRLNNFKFHLSVSAISFTRGATVYYLASIGVVKCLFEHDFLYCSALSIVVLSLAYVFHFDRLNNDMLICVS